MSLLSSVEAGSSSSHPTDSTEVSATAQALLQAHRDRLSNITPSNKRNDSNHGRSESIDSLQNVERSIASFERVQQQLDKGLGLGQQIQPLSPSSAKGKSVLQPIGSVAFWPANIVDADQVYVRQIPSGLSLADELKLEQSTLAFSFSSAASTGKNDVVVQTHLSNPSRTLDVKYLKMHVKTAQDQLESRKRRLKLAAHSLRLGSSNTDADTTTSRQTLESAPSHIVNQQDEALNEEGLPFFEPIEQLPDLQEGDSAPSPSAYMQPFVPTNAKLASDKTERRKWMDEVFSKLEQEEGDEEEDVQPNLEAKSVKTEGQEPLPADQEFRVVLRNRTPSPPPETENESETQSLPKIVSATRPPPPKPALKYSAASRPSIMQRPSFGSTGLRRGFLNLNPSSPGAIQSSYTQEELERDMPKSQGSDEIRPSRSHTPTPLTGAVSSVPPLSAISVGSSPIASGTSTPNRKSVRIKSPERAHPDSSNHTGLTPLQRALKSSIRVKEKDLTPQAASQPPIPSLPLPNATRLDSGSGTAEKRHVDDIGVEQEAEKIVNLLGPAVVEGHPSAPPSDLLLKMQQAHEQDQQLSTPQAIAERVKREEEERQTEHKRRLQEKPALGQAVMERAATVPKPASDKDGRASSGFNRGFLNQKPARFVPNRPVRALKSPASAKNDDGVGQVPSAPTQSLGMSALDRAALGDDDLGKRREEMGLPAAVPHARPSKAYAEKMKRKQAGLEPVTGSTNPEEILDVDDDAQKLARPKASDDVPRPGRVRFGAPQSNIDDHADVDGEESEINSAARLDNHAEADEGEVDEEDEEPKITGEGADADDDDEYFDSYLSDRAQQHVEGDDFGETDDLDWDIPSDDDIDDDDFDYDPEDLLALAPDMNADGFSGNDALLREYAEAKARLQALGLTLPGDDSDATHSLRARAARQDGADDGDDDEDDFVDDFVPLDATVDDPQYQGNTVSGNTGQGSRISRFKASLGSQQFSPEARTSEASSAQELATMFQSARNLGRNDSGTVSTSEPAWKGMDGMTSPESQRRGAPVMIIPQLAPVRFPKNGQVLAADAGKPVDLDGASSDDDDSKAELNMRSRLDRLEWQQNNPEQARKLAETRKLQRQLDQGVAPPEITHRQSAEAESVSDNTAVARQASTEQDTPAHTEADTQTTGPKKVSRFKASRMA